MKLLIDTNVFLEVLLEQPQIAAASKLLTNSDLHELFISDFALHSICVYLIRQRKIALLEQFLSDTIVPDRVLVLLIAPAELEEVIDAAQLLKLDFDDAYQYVVAEKNNLTLVSFDSDFDKTPRGRQAPQAINQLTSTNP